MNQKKWGVVGGHLPSFLRGWQLPRKSVALMAGHTGHEEVGWDTMETMLQ